MDSESDLCNICDFDKIQLCFNVVKCMTPAVDWVSVVKNLVSSFETGLSPWLGACCKVCDVFPFSSVCYTGWLSVKHQFTYFFSLWPTELRDVCLGALVWNYAKFAHAPLVCEISHERSPFFFCACFVGWRHFRLRAIIYAFPFHSTVPLIKPTLTCVSHSQSGC